MDTITIYLIVVPVFLLVFGGYLYLGKRKKDKTPPPASESHINDDKSENGEAVEETIEPVEARIYDNITRLCFNRNLSVEEIKEIRTEHGNLGRKVLRFGDWIYAINRYLDESGVEKLRPVYVTQTMEHPPSKLHRALTQNAVEIAYDVRDQKGFMEKYGKVLLFVGVVLFLMWTIVMK